MNFMIQLYVEVDGVRTPNPALSPEEFQREAAARRQAHVAALWQAAHDYEYAEISGTATGMLVRGVIRDLPRSMAIQAWILSIWALYYQRKATVTHEMTDDMLDFSSCGPIPYTIPELWEEVMG